MPHTRRRRWPYWHRFPAPAWRRRWPRTTARAEIVEALNARRPGASRRVGRASAAITLSAARKYFRLLQVLNAEDADSGALCALGDLSVPLFEKVARLPRRALRSAIVRPLT